jgi:hypothetical protein
MSSGLVAATIRDPRTVRPDGPTIAVSHRPAPRPGPRRPLAADTPRSTSGKSAHINGMCSILAAHRPFCGPPGTRTPNLWIKSPQLCH